MSKKGLLGCSFPVLLGVVILILALAVVSFLAGPLGHSLIGDLGLPSWIAVSSPHVELPAEAIFHIGSFPVSNSILAAWISMLVLIIISLLATRNMKMVPKGLQNLWEFALNALLDFCISVAGEKNGRRFFPVVATIFLFVLANAWLSLIPGYGTVLAETAHGEVHLLRGANTDINMPLALAVASFVAIQFFGLKSLGGFKYLSKFFRFGGIGKGFKQIFTGKVLPGLGSMFFGIIDVFVGLLELLSEFVRVVSFTFRLFGNMTAGEILLLIAMFLIPYVFALPFYGLELLVGFIQALIFGGLTLVFLTMACAHHEE